MAHDPPNPAARWLCVAIVAAGGLVCVGGAAAAAAKDEAEAAVAGWPTASGVVLEQDVSEARRPAPGRPARPQPDQPGYRVWVRYSYAVDGREYESTRFSPAGGWADEAAAADARTRYRPGAGCVVRYDPADPALAYLAADAPAGAGLPALCLGVAGVLQLGLAGLAAVWAVRPRDRAETNGPAGGDRGPV